MSTQPQQCELQFTANKVRRHREGKRQQIEAFFRANLFHRFSSMKLHGMFGSAVRSRISEINRDESCSIRILNECCWDQEEKAEVSTYWSERR